MDNDTEYTQMKLHAGTQLITVKCLMFASI